jgi:acetyl esterase
VIEDAKVDGPHGPVPVRLYRADDAQAALVWMHGGAFAFGDLDMPEADWVARELAGRGIAVCSVDYRLATDGVHYPVPADDALAAWQWASGAERPLGFERVHFGGASAGACLAAGVTKRARDAGDAMPASLVLVYPLVHCVVPEPSPDIQAALDNPPPNTFVFDPETIRLIMANYLGDQEVQTDPHAFAANGDHAGMPPTLIINAEADTLRASGEEFASDLAAAGIDVVVTTEPGTAHGFINEPSRESAQRSIQRIADWVVQTL